MAIPLSNLALSSELQPLMSRARVEDPYIPIRNEKILSAVLATVILSLIFLIIKKVRNKASKYSRRRSLINRFDGPIAYPIIGNAPQMFSLTKDFYKWTNTMCKRYEDPLRVWQFNHPVLFVSTYNIANQMLSKSTFNGKATSLDMIRRLPGGKGLSTNPPHIAHSRRKMLQPAFTKTSVDSQHYIFCEESQKLVRSLQQFADTGKEFNLMDLIMLCTFNISCRCAFGDDFMSGRDEAEAKTHMDALHEFALKMGNRIFSTNYMKKSDFIFYKLTSDGRKTMQCLITLNSFARKAICQARAASITGKLQEHQTEKEKDAIPDINGQIQNHADERKELKSSYLDFLLELEREGAVNDGEIIGEINNFLAGAYDTVALTVMWTLLALSLEPLYQDKIVVELVEVLGSKTKTLNTHLLTVQETRKLKYLEMCVKETLRLYPTAPFFPRSTPVDLQLDDGRIVPAGTDVIIMVNMMNLEEKYFPNPKEFKPERHLKQIREFMPFSIGGRNCIGQIHAISMTKVITAYLLKEFKWETTDTPENIECGFQALLYPVNGMNYKIQPRTTHCP